MAEKPLVQTYGAQSSSSILPNQWLSEDDKFKENGRWFYDMMQYICTYYNRPLRNVVAPAEFIDGTDETYTPAVKMVRNMLYYLGRQPNLNYAFLTQNIDGSSLQATWRKGQDIAPIIDHLKGNAYKALQNMQFSCTPLSKKAYAKRTEMYENLSLKQDLKEQFDELEKMGVSFRPSNGKKFKNQKEVDAFMKKGYLDAGADFATDIAKDIWNTDSALYKYLKDFENAVICGLGGTHHIIDNSRYYTEPILPYQAIVDTRIDDDFNSRAQFAGIINNLSVGEIYAKYPYLPDDVKEELSRMAQDNSSFTAYNKSTNFQWWTPSTLYGQATVSVVTNYWKCARDMDMKQIVNEYGIDAIAEIKDRGKQLEKAKKKRDAGKISANEYQQLSQSLKGDFIIEDIYKGTLIGNKWLLDYGYYSNVSENPLRHDAMLPIQIWMPSMKAGESRSVVDRLHQLQDEIDQYRFLIKEMVGRAMGKPFFIRGGSTGNGTSMVEIIRDIKSMGGSVLTESGEPGDNPNRLIESIDMTLDPNFLNIQNLIIALKNEMMDIVNTSKIALGQQTSYIGATTQAQAINQSTTGQTPLFQGFMDYVARNIQYGINVKKNLYVAYPDLLETGLNIGDEGVKYFENVITDDLLFEDFLLYIHIKDVIDDEARKRLLAYAQAWSQNPSFGVHPKDIIKLEKTTTFSEAEEVLQEAFEREETKQAEQQKIQQQLDEVKQTQQLQSAEAIETQRLVSKIFTSLTEIDRKGMWSIREEEVKMR